MQALDVAVLVVRGHLLRIAVRAGREGGAFAVGSRGQPVQAVVGELVAAQGGLAARLPGHAADVTVPAGRAAARVVIQVLLELRAADARQPAANVVAVSQLVARRPVQGLRAQAAHGVVGVAGQCHLRAVQRMLHLADAVGVVVGVGIDLRAGGLARGRMRAGDGQGLAAEAVSGRGDVVAAEQVVRYGFRHAPLDVIIVGRPDARAAAKYGDDTARLSAPCVARCVVRIVGVVARGNTEVGVGVIVVLHERGLAGQRGRVRAFSLFRQAAQIVIQVVAPLRGALGAPVAVLREGQAVGIVVGVSRVVRSRQLLPDAASAGIVAILEGIAVEVGILLVHRLQDEAELAEVVVDVVGVVCLAALQLAGEHDAIRSAVMNQRRKAGDERTSPATKISGFI